MKPECGIAKLIPRHLFDDAANGFLVNNRCTFGVEVFVLDSKSTGECFSSLEKVDKTYTWKVFKFSYVSRDIGVDGVAQYSNEFDAGSFRW